MKAPKGEQVKGWALLALGVGAVYLIAKAAKGAADTIVQEWGSGSRDSWPMPQGMAPTLSAAAAANIAERIHAAAWVGWVLYEDEEGMNDAILEANNDADLVRIANAYGRRRGPSLLDPSLNLFQLVQATHDDNERAALNAALRSQGVTLAL